MMKNNASLDKFCKIKAKKEEKHKKSATNGAEEIAGNGNWGVEEEKHKMGDDNKGGKLHDFRCPRIRHCPRLSHAGIQQPFPPSSNPLLNFSRGNQNYPKLFPESRLLVGLFRSSQRALDGRGSLQDRALALLAGLALADLQEGSTGSGLEDLTDTLVGTGRALEVLVGTNLLADLLTL
jgi:hypothetical protein